MHPIILEAQKVLDESKAFRAEQKKRRQKENQDKFFKAVIKNGFWIIFFAVLAVVGFVYRVQIDTFIKAKVVAISPKSTQAASATTSIDCGSLDLTISTSADGKTQISVPSITEGHCYQISAAARTTWQLLFSDQTKVNQYATKIFNESDNHNLTLDVITAAITKSLTTDVVDLR